MKKSILMLGALPFALSAQPTIDVDLRIDADKRAEAINPMIYGQFIEHMGRCIYGGIWAEMLEDRKFYHSVTEDYDPYGDQTLADPDFPGIIDTTEFPVVSSSPWEIVGEPSGVTMVTEDSFVGKHTPQIATGSGIRQNDLGIKEGLAYPGYLWVKPIGGSAEVEVSLNWGDGEDQKRSQVIKFSGKKYAKKDFAFTPDETTSQGASLAVRVLSGTIQLGTLSLMPGDNINGMRSDTIELLKELDSPIYRWPGGNFVSGYDWRDGIGDRDRRPPRTNPAWTGVEHNDFGTDEFLAFCRLLETEPMIAANTGFGDAYSAKQWVEYANGDTSTIGGSWRAENGNKKPYDVEYWCVGNEMWGNWQLGHMQLHHYTLKHNRVAEAMLEADSDLILIASGDLERVNETDLVQVRRGVTWTEGMLKDSHEYMDYISEHFYTGRTPWSDTERGPIAEHLESMRQNIRTKAEGHRELQPKLEELDGKQMPIAMTEWNYWHRNYKYGELGCVYDIADGLGIAAGLHEYFRHTDIIDMALYAQTVNVIGAIKTTRIAAEMATTGIALTMYRRHFGTLPVEVEFEHDVLDVSAALTEDGKALTLSVINPTESEITVGLDLSGFALSDGGTRWHFSGPDEFAHNTPGKKRVVEVVETEISQPAEGLSSPALSASIFVLPLNKAVK
ncbi:alpha-L-arabinofuranosidase C-terminal domain-containing protein [Pelagicoccus sp. SDUM812002]|uniref:alpha-L-arabinofuranosidase C-terminal domain-containing protein n=1 Tax=Pelagicoccus sp. SDUM812002 TaxID=3041266 RepID=UPI00280CD5CC|nr:alpha-L-arabinofuranosidase C-terminal domain-containing protein [Pelagicoccus sp. SDUM812002]MDQ8185172.1 alpha-L-arabinofuranosidase C-terminal domain-containing protein [Pelagicoccus sp. SDUM812002]